MNDFLSRGLNDLFLKNPTMYFHIPKCLHVTHLDYADDCIIFCNGKFNNLRKLKLYLEQYETISGQKVNLQKSGFIAVKDANVNNIISSLVMSPMSFPFTYIGAPICKGRKKKIAFESIVTKIRLKLTGWNISSLSQGS